MRGPRRESEREGERQKYWSESDNVSKRGCESKRDKTKQRSRER